MGFLKRMFGSGEEPGEESTNPEPKSYAPVVIGGGRAGEEVLRLVEMAKAEGWHAVGSIKVRCSACSEPVALTQGPSFAPGPCFGLADGSMKELEDPIACACGSDSFEVYATRQPFREILREIIDARPACEEDPAEGFRCLETKERIRDHSFVPSSSYEELWKRVGKMMVPDAKLNARYQFDFLRDRRGGPHSIEYVNGVCQVPCSGTRIVIFKDTRGRYWSHVEQR